MDEEKKKESKYILFSRAHPLAFGERYQPLVHFWWAVVPAMRIELFRFREDIRVRMAIERRGCDNHLQSQYLENSSCVGRTDIGRNKVAINLCPFGWGESWRSDNDAMHQT